MADTHSRSRASTARPGSPPRPTNALSCVSVIVVVAASVRTRAGRSSDDRSRLGVLLQQGDELVDDAVVEVVHHLADLRVGVAGHRARLQHRVVVGVDRRGAADHPLGELRGRLSRLTGGEVVGQAVEQLACVGQDHGEHRVLRVEVEVEAGSRDTGTLADGAHGQVGERPLMEQFADGRDDRVALPVAPAAPDLLRCRIQPSCS